MICDQGVFILLNGCQLDVQDLVYLESTLIRLQKWSYVHLSGRQKNKKKQHKIQCTSKMPFWVGTKQNNRGNRREYVGVHHIFNLEYPDLFVCSVSTNRDIYH